MMDKEPNEVKTDIEKLNEEVKVRVAPSKIHGVGVFPLRPLKRGERLYAGNLPSLYKTPYARFWMLNPEVRQYLLERWPNVINGSSFVYPEGNIQAFMNHANEPTYNAESDTLLTDLTVDDEITEDYKKIKGYAQIFPWLVV